MLLNVQYPILTTVLLALTTREAHGFPQFTTSSGNAETFRATMASRASASRVHPASG